MQKLLILYLMILFNDRFDLDDKFNKLSHNATHYHNTYLKCLISMYAWKLRIRKNTYTLNF